MSTAYESPNWPASPQHLSAARQFLTSLSKKEDNRPVLILPDRDVDGLTSGGIMHRVVSQILLKDRKIDVPVQFVTKGAWIGDPSDPPLETAGDVRRAIALTVASGVFVTGLGGTVLALT